MSTHLAHMQIYLHEYLGPGAEKEPRSTPVDVAGEARHTMRRDSHGTIE